MIPEYPEAGALNAEMRPTLHPLFQKLPDGISEFTFACLYLFRETHNYRISRLPDVLHLINGRNGDNPFFMLPFGLPGKTLLDKLFDRFKSMEAVSERQAAALSEMGYSVEEDRDNFDYLYSRAELATLPGRKFHKKKNRVNAFIDKFEYEARPLLTEYTPDALAILERWRSEHNVESEYRAAKEALVKMDYLQLCGGIYYVERRPVAYTLGEENALGSAYLIHFEKAVEADRYTGIYQFINQSFAAILPEKYTTINREQDLGDAGLRQAKESYNPVGFVKKFRAKK
jgi:hypothetical protein